MTYYGDPVKGGFGEYARKEYSGIGDADPLLVAKMAQRNSKVLPAGLQPDKTGVVGMGDADPFLVSKMAQRNFKVLPAGLQPDLKSGLSGLSGSYSYGYNYTMGDLDPYDVSKMAQKNSAVLPAGLQPDKTGVVGFGETDADPYVVSRLAVKNRHAIPAGGSLGDADHSAFDGFGDADGWATFFNKASSASNDTDLLDNLQKAVVSVPDNTPKEIKLRYYEMAMAMLRRRKAGNLNYMDVKRMEIESNIGWLINSMIPKSGGFAKSAGRAIAAIGSELAKNEKSHLTQEKMIALGVQLKDTLKKTVGLGEDSSPSNKWWCAGLVVAVAAGLWYHHKTKAKKARRK